MSTKYLQKLTFFKKACHKKKRGRLFSRKQGLGIPKLAFSTNTRLKQKKQPAVACSAVNSCWGYQSIQKIPLIMIDIIYFTLLVLNKPYMKYYIALPILPILPSLLVYQHAREKMSWALSKESIFSGCGACHAMSKQHPEKMLSLLKVNDNFSRARTNSSCDT